jgi:hypothetical protein
VIVEEVTGIPIDDRRRDQGHGVERVGQWLLIPRAHPWGPCHWSLLLTTVDGQRREGWHEGRPDLLWRTIGKGANQHSLWAQVRLLDSNPPPQTRPHLNSVSPGVEVGGPQTIGGSGVVGATTTVVTVVIVLLLARLLQL